MVIHAVADSDMPIVYFSLMINNKKKIIKAEKSKTIGKNHQIPTNGRISYTKHCRVFS